MFSFRMPWLQSDAGGNAAATGRCGLPVAPRISVVINTLNRAEHLDRTLSSLHQLRYPNFEVVVVQGPCTDSTEDILKRHAGSIRVGHCPQPNLSMSRNIGIAMAKGDIVAFIDDDAVPEPDWLDRLIAGFNDPKVAAVGGFIRNPDGISFQYRFVIADRFGNASRPRLGARRQASGRFTSPTGTNIAIRRDALLKIGGFDEHYAYFLDETDVNVRLVDAGFGLVIAPQAEVHHKFAPNDVRAADRVPRSLYLIARSKSYFCWRNAISLHGERRVREYIAAYRNRRQNVVRTMFDKNRIDGETRDRLIAEIARGVEDGTRAARSNAARVLISETLLETHAPDPYRRFPQPLPLAERMRICIVATAYPPHGNDLLGRWTQDFATQMAMRGHEITVIFQSADQPAKVDFAEGVWLHAVAAPRLTSAAVAAEIARIQPRRAFQIVCRPVLDHGGAMWLRCIRLSLTGALDPALLRRDPLSLWGHWRTVAMNRVLRASRTLARSIMPLFRMSAPNPQLSLSGIPATGDSAEFRHLPCERHFAALLSQDG